MAVVELQFSEQAFGGLLRSLVNSRRLPAASITDPLQPSVNEHPLDSITCTGCVLSEGAGEGEIKATLDLLIRYYDSCADARAAGSLKQPATKQIVQSLPLAITAQLVPTAQGLRPVLSYSIFLNLFPGGQVELGGLASFPAQSISLVLGDGVVAIRLGTQADDPVTAAAVNRLVIGSEWSQFVPGELLALALTESLEQAVTDLADDEHVPGAPAAGAYVTIPMIGRPPPPFAMAAAMIIAVDACPLFKIDVPVSILLVGTFVANGPSLEVTVRMSWSADSFWCEVAGSLILEPIAIVIASKISAATSDAFLGQPSPEGYKEIARDEHSITYQQRRLLDVPAPLVLTQSQITDTGLVLSGKVQPQRRVRGLEGFVKPPASVLRPDCGTRSVSVTFSPAIVELQDYDPPGGAPKLFSEWTHFDPPDAWAIVSSIGNNWNDLRLTFVDPPGGRLAPGTPTSVFLMTDCGLRWVDLGVVPVPHPPPTNADIAKMISHCMARSAGWLEKVFSVKWLPRPPEVFRDGDAIRLWQIGFENVPDTVHLEFVAVADGRERSLGVAPRGRHVAAQVTTDADEEIEIRSSDASYQGRPIVSQRWIMPKAVLKTRKAPVGLAFSDGRLGLRFRDGTQALVSRSASGFLKALPTAEARLTETDAERLSAAFDREQGRQKGEGLWANFTQVDDHTVAVLHRGALTVGSLGPTQIL